MLGRRTLGPSGIPAPGAIAVAREAAEEREIAALREEGARVAMHLEPHVNRGLQLVSRGRRPQVLQGQNWRDVRLRVQTSSRGVLVASSHSYAVDALRAIYERAGYCVEDAPGTRDGTLRQILILPPEVAAREEGSRIAEVLRPSVDRALAQYTAGKREGIEHDITDEGIRELVVIREPGVVVMCSSFAAINNLRIHYTSAGYWVSDKPDPEHPDLHRLRVAPMHDCDPWSVSC